MAGDGRTAWKNLVAFAHPLADSLSAALKAAVVGGLEEAGHSADVIDLYADKFDASPAVSFITAFRNRTDAVQCGLPTAGNQAAIGPCRRKGRIGMHGLRVVFGGEFDQ